MNGFYLSQIRKSRHAYAHPGLPSDQSRIINTMKETNSLKLQHMRRRRIGLESFELNAIFNNALIETTNISMGTSAFGPIGKQYDDILSDTNPIAQKKLIGNRKPTYARASRLPIKSPSWSNSPFA